jgi:hypothetical protein
MATRKDLIERAAAAYERASCPHRQGPYGLFDYSSYGAPIPHVVRDLRERGGETFDKIVFRSTDRGLAQREFEHLTRMHVFGAVVDAILSGVSTDDTR